MKPTVAPCFKVLEEVYIELSCGRIVLFLQEQDPKSMKNTCKHQTPADSTSTCPWLGSFAS